MSEPILFLVFNRPELTYQSFDCIRRAKPNKLYVACDGPRCGTNEDKILQDKVLKIVKNVDWECEVKYLIREENLGCGRAVSSAIDWFFKHEERGIIVEDDIIFNENFPKFCSQMLEKYQNDLSIGLITGNNITNKSYGNEKNEGFFLNENALIWGWATWRRVWNMYDYNMKGRYYQNLLIKINERSNNCLGYKNYWTKIIKAVENKKIDTWDYQLQLAFMANDLHSIVPSLNLVMNIGFRNGTHAGRYSKYLDSQKMFLFNNINKLIRLRELEMQYERLLQVNVFKVGFHALYIRILEKIYHIFSRFIKKNI